ncbi:type II toxin-antitoxin system PemK/MazF family toxin [Cellulomonas hominis]
MIRGAVYRIDLGRGRGHEQGGHRHGVVLAPADGALWSVVIVVPTSTSAQPARFRPQLELMGRTTVLLVDQMRAIDSTYVIGGPEDYLDPHELDELEHAVGRYLGIG